MGFSTGNTFCVIMKSTFDCNLNCSYCYQKGVSKGSSYPRMMPLLIIKKTIEKFRDAGYKRLELQWIGGETTLPGIKYFRDIFDLSRMYSDNSFQVFNRVQSNCTLLNESWFSALSDFSDVFDLSISYDVYLDYFETIQEMPEKKSRLIFNKIENNIDRLVEDAVDFGVLVTVDLERNISPREMFDKLIQKGIRKIAFQLNYSHVFDFGISSKGDLYIDFLKEMFKFQYEHNLRNVKDKVYIRESLYLQRYIQSNEYSASSCHNHASLCNSYMWSIDTNGDVYGTCDSFVRNFDDKVESIIIGNIAVESVEGIMFGEKHQRLQEVFFNLRNESKCLKCSFYKFCNGGCPVYKSENNSLETFNDKSGYCNYMRKYFSLIENEDVNFFHSAI